MMDGSETYRFFRIILDSEVLALIIQFSEAGVQNNVMLP